MLTSFVPLCLSRPPDEKDVARETEMKGFDDFQRKVRRYLLPFPLDLACLGVV
jgi:hypothetical protein